MVSVLGQTVLLGLLFAVVIFFVVLQLGRYQGITFSSESKPATETFWPSLRPSRSTWLVERLGWVGYYRFWSWRKIVAVLFGIVFMAALSGWWWILSALVLAAGLLVVWLAWRINLRRRSFIQQLPEALDALVQALRSGYAMPEALALVEREAAPPMREVFAALTRAEQYRLTLAEAVRLLEDQLALPEWNLVAETIQLQRTLGGNIIPVLHEVAGALREKIRIDDEVHSLTASSRLSGLIIAGLAPLSLLAFMMFSPSYISVLTQSTLGHLLLLIAGSLEVLGFLIIWRLVQVDY